MRPEKINFAEVVRSIQAKGAFKDYDKPLGTSNAKKIDKLYNNPKYPGQACYGNGPTNLRHGLNLQQDLVDAQHKSFADAIALYLPRENFISWMHEYFSGDFLSSNSYRSLSNKVDFPRDDNEDELLNDELTMNLDSPDRKRNDRKMYTSDEIKTTYEVSKKHPEIAMSILAFQASYVQYLRNLREEVEYSKELNNLERNRGLGVIESLIGAWTNNNFIDNILPAIAIHIHKNSQGQEHSPDAQDFMQGMMFAVKNGMFRNGVKGPDKEMRQFTCPAQRIINATSSVKVNEPDDKKLESQNMGIAIFHIFREVVKQKEQGTLSYKENEREIQAKINEEVERFR